jgi:hypothetical protein
LPHEQGAGTGSRKQVGGNRSRNREQETGAGNRSRKQEQETGRREGKTERERLSKSIMQKFILTPPFDKLRGLLNSFNIY